MTDLQDALKTWDLRGLMAMSEEQMEAIVDAARMWLNPNIEAMARRLAEEREGISNFPLDSFDLELAEELWAAALTPGDTKQ